jgi:hypothetical protein
MTTITRVSTIDTYDAEIVEAETIDLLRDLKAIRENLRGNWLSLMARGVLEKWQYGILEELAARGERVAA